MPEVEGREEKGGTQEGICSSCYWGLHPICRKASFKGCCCGGARRRHAVTKEAKRRRQEFIRAREDRGGWQAATGS